MLSYLVFSFLFFSSRPEIDFADVVLQGEQWGLGGVHRTITERSESELCVLSISRYSGLIHSVIIHLFGEESKKPEQETRTR